MSNTYTKLIYHIVFSAKNRLPLITSAIQDDLYRYIGAIVTSEDSTLLAIGGMPDHVHLLVQTKPAVALSDFLRQLKSNSSKWLNERVQTLHKFAWQEGYAAFTVSPSQVSRVRAYIQDQTEHHRAIDFQSELRELLKRHGIDFDEQFLWN